MTKPDYKPRIADSILSNKIKGMALKNFLFSVLLFLQFTVSAGSKIDFFAAGINWHILDSKNLLVEAVSGQPTLSSVVIPQTVEFEDKTYTVVAIADSAFFSLTNLIEVEIPVSAIYIGSSAFENCSSLNTIYIPTSITKIGEGAFAHCISLENITLPPTINIIEDATFKNCSSLRSFNIPLSVNLICPNAFKDCSSLLEIQIPPSVNEIGEYAFAGCTLLENIVLPLSIRYLSKGIFQDCASLRDIELPVSVSYIGESAFEGCDAITHISIPMSIRHIGARAFLANGIESVDYNSPLPQYFGASQIFSEITYRNATLFVPEGSESLAQIVKPWANFSQISSKDFSGITPIFQENTVPFSGNPQFFNLLGQPIPQYQLMQQPGIFVSKSKKAYSFRK